MKLISSLIFTALFTAGGAFAATFSQCPAVGNDTSGCEFLITVTSVSGGAATAFTVTASTPDLGPYDGADDTVVGVLNSSGSTLTSLSLSSSLDIFGFDGDGVCTYVSCPGATDPSGYAPAGVTYSGVNAAETAGTVNFLPGLANGASNFFSLEEALTVNQILPGNASPEPSSILLMGLGMAGFSVVCRRFRKSAR